MRAKNFGILLGWEGFTSSSVALLDIYHRYTMIVSLRPVSQVLRQETKTVQHNLHISLHTECKITKVRLQENHRSVGVKITFLYLTAVMCKKKG